MQNSAIPGFEEGMRKTVANNSFLSFTERLLILTDGINKILEMDEPFSLFSFTPFIY